MERYKDADALVENIKRVYCTDCNNYNEIRCRACGTDDAIAMIEDAPTADVVAVVRCKDCRLRDTEGCPFMAWDCGELMGETNDTDFCSRGEREEQT